MDLSTIKKKLHSGKYSSIGECIEDIELIWSNCKLYNQESSEIYKAAEKMEKHYLKVTKNLIPVLKNRSAMEIETEVEITEI